MAAPVQVPVGALHRTLTVQPHLHLYMITFREKENITVMLLLSGGGSQLVIKVLKDEDLQGREEQT